MTGLAAGVVRIYTASPVNFMEGDLDDLNASLDADEQLRARRFRFREDQLAFILVHALRRRAIAKALGCSIESVQFKQTTDGRPLLCTPRPSEFYFSHSRRRTAVAVALTRIAPIGIDLESHRPGTVEPALLLPFVAAHGLAGPDPAGQDTFDFLEQWTALEAYWKAVGTGLDTANPKIRLRRGAAARIEIAHESDAPRRVRAHAFQLNTPHPACVMAVALLSADAPQCEWQVRHCNSSIEIS